MSIPVVFLFSGDAKILLSALEVDPKLKVTLQNSVGKLDSSFNLILKFALSVKSFTFLNLWISIYLQCLPTAHFSGYLNNIAIKSLAVTFGQEYFDVL